MPRKAARTSNASKKRARGGKDELGDDPNAPGLTVLEARKIRNRLSAAQSRERQRNHVSNLEAQVAQLTARNTYLEERVRQLEAAAAAADATAPPTTPTQKKATTAPAPMSIESIMSHPVVAAPAPLSLPSALPATTSAFPSLPHHPPHPHAHDSSYPSASIARLRCTEFALLLD